MHFSTRIGVIVGLSLSAGLPHIAVAQQAALPLTLSGEVRVRTELDGRSAGVPSDLVSLLRTRIGLTATPNNEVRAVIRLSDSRVFGEETNTLTDASADRFDLHEGFIEWSPASRQGMRVRLGRQELAYGDERFIGTVGWANVTRAFDGVQVRVPVSGWTVDGFGVTLREFDATSATGVDPRQNEGQSRDQSLFGLWATNGSHDLFAIAETRVAGSGSSNIFRRTVGAHASGTVGPIVSDLTLAAQFGSQRAANGSTRDIAAWLASGSVMHPFGGSAKAHIGLQVDILSGDDDPADGTDRAFNTLYATNHKFYGFMDLILDPASQLSGRGLMDVALRGSMQHAGWKLALDAHRFQLMQERGAASERALGTEWDATASRSLAAGLGLVTGASLFRPGDAARHAGIGLGDRTLWWSYVQVTVTF